MSQDLARVGDMFVGVCYSHDTPLSVTGVLVSGSGDVTSDGQGNCRIGDLGIGTCGHISAIVTGSSSLLINGMGAARVGDLIAGPIKGIIISGSGSVASA